MIILPLFSLLFLIINPVLFWIFSRLDQNLQKLGFWMMLTTGLAWLISAAFFFLSPDQQLNPIWDAGEKLLPSLAFSLDRVSSSYFLAVTAIIFFAILVEEYSPQTNAWITALGGACALGTLVDSAYALALVWTSIEVLSLYRYLKNQGEIGGNQRYMLLILVRLASPLLLIYVSLIHSDTGSAPFVTELPASAAGYLLAAGVVGFAGWSLADGRIPEEGSDPHPGKYASRIPAVLGLLLITRAAQIWVSEGSGSGIFILVAVLLFLFSAASSLFMKPERSWIIGSLCLLIGSYSFSAMGAVLAWGVVFLLPGIVLFRNYRSNKTAALALALGGVGILPLPFLPAWIGLSKFGGIAGLFYAALGGIFLGKAVNLGIQTWQKEEEEAQLISPLVITGYVAVLLSQLAISIQSGLVPTSLRITAIPVAAWAGVVFFVPAALFWSKIPDVDLPWWGKTLSGINRILTRLETALPQAADSAVYLFTRLFEGDGGLIWTLLIGFLIITLISLRGG